MTDDEMFRMSFAYTVREDNVLEVLPVDSVADIVEEVLLAQHPLNMIDLQRAWISGPFRASSNLRRFAVWRLLQASSHVQFKLLIIAQCFTLMICNHGTIDFFRNFLQINAAYTERRHPSRARSKSGLPVLRLLLTDHHHAYQW
jgi:hypothetical protein